MPLFKLGILTCPLCFTRSTTTMPPAFCRTCDYPGCKSGPEDHNNIRRPFITSEDNRWREELTEDIKQHVEMAHMIPIRLEDAATKKIEAKACKVEAKASRILVSRKPNLVQQTDQQQPSIQTRTFQHKRGTIPKAKIEESSTESDWGFYKA